MKTGERDPVQCRLYGYDVIVGHLSDTHAQPTTADDLLINTVLRRDLARRHELDRGTQGIANRQAEIGADRPATERPDFG